MRPEFATRQLYDRIGRAQPGAVRRSSVSWRALRHHGLRPRRVHPGPEPRASGSRRRHHRPEPAAFRRLGSSFEGRTVTGIGFDRDTLKAARIDDAYAFAAVSSGDNSNILAARVARETYGVEHVVARIYDPGRARSTSGSASPRWPRCAGPPTRCCGCCSPRARAGAHRPERACRHRPGAAGPVWVGRRLTEIESATGSRIAYVTRLGDGLIPGRTRCTRTATWCMSSRRRRPRPDREGPRPAAAGPLTFDRDRLGPVCASSSPEPAVSGGPSPESCCTTATRCCSSTRTPTTSRRRASPTRPGCWPTPARSRSSRRPVHECDVVVAATGDDKVNLVVSLLAKTEFGVPRTVARVNNPKNEWMFDEAWGVDVAVSTPRLMTALVEEAVSVGDLVRIFEFQQAKASMVELTLPGDSPYIGKRVARDPVAGRHRARRDHPRRPADRAEPRRRARGARRAAVHHDARQRGRPRADALPRQPVPLGMTTTTRG